MSWNIFTEYPFWFILFCLILGGVYATGLYFREYKNEFPAWLRIILGVIRFITVTLISFMLLSPFIRSIVRTKEKPVIIIAQDNSRSLLLNKDSTYYKNSFPKELGKLSDGLSAVGDVKIYTFGENVSVLSPGEKPEDKVTFSERMTDISLLIKDLADIYTNRNVGALIISSDGIFNSGANPVYVASGWNYPIYSIALGDTNIRKDLIIARVNYNRIVFLNNRFPVEVVVHAHECYGSKSAVRIFDGKTELFSQVITINGQNFTGTYSFMLDAKETGLKKYTIRLDHIDEELSLLNNVKDIFIEVLDARSKILILANSPHPDIAAIRQAIETNFNYEVDYQLMQDFTGKLDPYNLVILHQLPSEANPAQKLVAELQGKKLPVLFILGSQSDLIRFNAFRAGVNIVVNRTLYEEALPMLNHDFSLFSLSEETRQLIQDFSPLIVPVGEYQPSNSTSPLLYQRIGNVQTSRPLMMFNEGLDSRYGVITGEGVWKWRLMNYARTQDHQAFNELINKTIQFLSIRDIKKNFKVYHKSNYLETEHVTFDSELYNDSYELINDPEVELNITNEEEKQFPFVFNKTGRSYRLDAGSFAPGNYKWKAETKIGEKIYTAGGEFSVSSLDLEAVRTVADHNLLFNLAGSKNGKMYYPDQLDELKTDILEREDVRPVTYSHKRYNELVNLPWVVILLIGLLTLEWFIRKRAGGY